MGFCNTLFVIFAKLREVLSQYQKVQWQRHSIDFSAKMNEIHKNYLEKSQAIKLINSRYIEPTLNFLTVKAIIRPQQFDNSDILFK